MSCTAPPAYSQFRGPLRGATNGTEPGGLLRKALASACVLALVVPVADAKSKNEEAVAAAAGIGIIVGLAARSHARRTTMRAERGQTSEPQFAQESWARPGQAIFASYNFDAVEAFVTTAKYRTDLSKIFGPGQIFYSMVNGKHCLPDGDICVKDKDGDGDLDKLDYKFEGLADVPYDLQTIRFDASEEGFRSEILYLGSAAGILRLQYREFIDDMARPAFGQDLVFSVEPTPFRIAFQDLEIEVIEVGNMGIRYRAYLSE